MFARFRWFLLFCVILLSGCEFVPFPYGGFIDDRQENPWVGTWTLDSIDGERLTDLFIEDEFGEVYGYSDWTFNADGTWEAWFDFGFESENGIEIGGHLWFYLEGTYTLDGERYLLAIETDGAAPLFDLANENAGTWHIEGDMLTLIDDYGSVVVFYRYVEWIDAEKGGYPE